VTTRTQRSRKNLDPFENIMMDNLEMAIFIRETGRCMKCGTAVLFEVEENGDTSATCPGCKQILGWSKGFFK